MGAPTLSWMSRYVPKYVAAAAGVNSIHSSGILNRSLPETI
jgi:hypothetical protein